MICSTVLPFQSRPAQLFQARLAAASAWAKSSWSLIASISPLDDNFSIDHDRLNICPAAVLDESIDGIAHRSIACRSKVDDDNVGFGSRRNSSQIVSDRGQSLRQSLPH
jgi:hypothetical protein